jgi:hypothetical protein
MQQHGCGCSAHLPPLLVDLPALADAAGDPALAQKNLGLADTRSGTTRRRHDFALAVHINEQNRV